MSFSISARFCFSAGLTSEVFTRKNLEKAFGGVLRHFTFEGSAPAGQRATAVLSDDERPFVVFDDDEGPDEPGAAR